MNLIFLVGMPGAGKTHWGRVWSEQHGFDFADLDEHIEAQAGLSIPEIFKGVGEQGFRVLEASVLLDSIAAAKGRDTIIATGGGTPIFDSNMITMLRGLPQGKDRNPACAYRGFGKPATPAERL